MFTLIVGVLAFIAGAFVGKDKLIAIWTKVKGWFTKSTTQ